MRSELRWMISLFWLTCLRLTIGRDSRSGLFKTEFIFFRLTGVQLIEQSRAACTSHRQPVARGHLAQNSSLSRADGGLIFRSTTTAAARSRELPCCSPAISLSLADSHSRQSLLVSCSGDLRFRCAFFGCRLAHCKQKLRANLSCLIFKAQKPASRSITQRLAMHWMWTCSMN